MKYKLIKDYPRNALPLGNTVTKDSSNQYVSDDIQIFLESEVELYPEFWKKIEEDDYEIISFIRTAPNSNLSGFRYVLNQNSKNYVSNGVAFPLDFMLHEGSCVDIESIKRLLDNEVFTIGNKVEHSYLDLNNLIITKIYTIEKIYTLESDDIRFYVGNGLNLGLERLKKYIPKSVFTTEDGVELFEGDKFWHVDTYFGIGQGIIMNLFVKLKGYHEFSTKEKAQEYVDLYKPQYSMKSILDSSENFWNNTDLILLDLNKLKSKK